ncbi:CHASE2 domain-containing protein [Pseudanabaena sp. FACHB-2040]|uniref:CHASE2 domain-containing protein n=1 Tax=Pseudanabaena sp. FACHB-2040 TaxID=2692859 RepID=UPI0016833DC2|nr:CHASE2 domain-containing protein [Pseudanabaena sp. FACHB-2040]MBD2256100.1 CHASE2 domain-containing protein [Pseudanabaena sp. FACHB-2040]
MSWRLSKVWWWLLPGGLVALVVTVLFELGVWQPLEQLVYTSLFRLRGSGPWSEQVVVVAIDDESLEKLGQFPLPRQRYAQLLDILSEAQPNVVAFDILWSEPSQDDSQLAAAMERHGLVVLPRALNDVGVALLPTSELQSGAITTGHISTHQDIDGIVRRIEPQLQGELALGLAATQAYALVAAPTLEFPSLNRPLWINWAGVVQHTPHYSLARVLEGEVSPEAFQNRIVVVGVTATGLDSLSTPFNRNPPASGVYLHATVINNVLQHNFLHVPSQSWIRLGLLLAGPSLSLLLVFCPKELRLISWIGCCLIWAILSLVLFRAGHWLPVASPLILLSGTTGAAMLSNRLQEDALLRRQLDQLWQAYHQDLVVYQAKHTDLSKKVLSQSSRVNSHTVQLAALADQFGRSQSAQAAIARSLSTGLLAADLDGLVWFCNPVAASWLSVKVGDRLASCLVPHWLSEAEWQANLHRLKTSGFTSSCELHRNERWFEIGLEPLLYHSQTLEAKNQPCAPDGLLLVIKDITERQEIVRLKDEFVSIVSHELRTPITSIRGSLGLLLTGKLGNLTDKGQHMLNIAVNNTDRLIRLINDILDFERIESGKVALLKKSCDVADLIVLASETMQAMADKAEVNLKVTTKSIYCCADPDRLIQVLTNLLSNAIKFSPQNTTVCLSAEIINPSEIEGIRSEASRFNSNPAFLSSLTCIPHPALLITVQDQGRGIPADKLEAIFGRFQQVDTSDARQKGGTGLGLAICRAIVEQHGGKIWVESTLGEGSTFYLILPGIEELEICHNGI